MPSGVANGVASGVASGVAAAVRAMPSVPTGPVAVAVPAKKEAETVVLTSVAGAV